MTEKECHKIIFRLNKSNEKLQAEIEQLRAEAKCGNISYREAIALKAENQQLKNYLRVAGHLGSCNGMQIGSGVSCTCGFDAFYKEEDK